MSMWLTKRQLLREFSRERQAWGLERRELLDRIMLLSGKPWGLPPSTSDEGEYPHPDPDLVEDPEQMWS